MRILLAEDDHQLSESLTAALALEGYAVDCFACGEQALSAARAVAYEALILDIGLPRRSGLQVLKALRQDGAAMPIILLTARDSVVDRVSGLDLGADDYLGKPFDMDELFARLRSLLRRSAGSTGPVLIAGDLELRLQDHEVLFKGEPVVLTAKEKALLELLVRNRGRFLTKSRLEDGLYRWGEEVGSNTVEVYISRLRKHFGSSRIETLRGVGYRFVE